MPLVFRQVLRSLAEGIQCRFDFICGLFGLIELFPCFIVSLRPAAFLFELLADLPDLLGCLAPLLFADIIDSFVSPLNDMEMIHATLAMRDKLPDAIIDPAGTIAGDNFDAGALLRGQQLKEL